MVTNCWICSKQCRTCVDILWHLIWVYTVHSGLSVSICRENMCSLIIVKPVTIPVIILWSFFDEFFKNPSFKIVLSGRADVQWAGVWCWALSEVTFWSAFLKNLSITSIMLLGVFLVIISIWWNSLWRTLIENIVIFLTCVSYIKEFVHGDFARTKPNLTSLLGVDCDILELDVQVRILSFDRKTDLVLCCVAPNNRGMNVDRQSAVTGILQYESPTKWKCCFGSCVDSEGPDQTVLPCSLIRAFAVC